MNYKKAENSAKLKARKRSVYGPSGGAGGIRTHVPLRTNGFQDRLVMTSSIPLRMCAANRFSSAASVILTKKICSVNNFFKIFFIFFFTLKNADFSALFNLYLIFFRQESYRQGS